MNKLLANALASLNSVIASLIILVATVVGSRWPDNLGSGAILGLLVGVVIATMTCGVLALVIDIRDQLKRIAAVSSNSTAG